MILCACTLCSMAQDVFKYHRSSMYSVLLKHENRPFGKEIETAFKSIPIPDKFDEHSLSRQVFKAAVLEENDSVEDNQKPYIDELLQKNAIGRRLVGKWFNQQKGGTFNCDLLVKRGYYNADAFDVALADRTILRRDNIIRDAGTELIGNTYVVVHDIQYYDRRKTGSLLSNIVSAVGIAAAAIPIVGVASITATSYATWATESVAGFKVSVTSYLYRLDWNDEIEGTFYNKYYTATPNQEKQAMFNKDKSLFTLHYVGKQTVYSGITTMRGVNRQEEFFVKVCTRAMDAAIALLQKEHEEFRIKTPLLSTSPITAKIGMKEGVDEKTRFEVLEVSEENGLTKYKRVGIIKPVKGKIWDNRYLAEAEEENQSSSLTATEFVKESGGDFYPGLLIRELSN